MSKTLRFRFEGRPVSYHRPRFRSKWNPKGTGTPQSNKLKGRAKLAALRSEPAGNRFRINAAGEGFRLEEPVS